MKQERRTWSGMSTIAITVFFLVCFLSLILFGTNIYRGVAESHTGNNNRRAVLSYLLTISRTNEADVKAEEGAYGDMLVIADGDTGYSTRIYQYEGSLVEDYGRSGGELYPSDASRIADNSMFEIEEISDDLLMITTDKGIVYIHVRGGGR